MSQQITNAKDLVYYPAQFPAQGRLPTQAALVGQNCHQQNSQERAYRQELCLAANSRVEPPCCKTLHISLFFDGTGNNLNNDLYVSRSQKEKEHPTNIARLFRASIGSGYAGGVEDAEGLLDDAEESGSKYFKYYIPGVGTPFPEVNDLDYSLLGLAGAEYGEERINWALLRLIDVLQFVLTGHSMSNAASLQSVKAMKTSWKMLGFGGSHNRYEEFTKQLKALEPQLRTALAPAEPGKPKLLGLKLYIYGFSRGAAEARAFVKWLSELLPKPVAEGVKPEQCLAIGDLKIPISVEFLGLLDTVASVGIAHIAPFVEGHMAWASGTQELPDEATYGGLIKRCVHLVSSHEQRLCFPLDSIRRTNGKYPANSVEVVYPGMHSDLGGGYPPGDQGKANEGESKENKVGDGQLLSQIALHEMYAAAFAVGAPLKVPKTSLPKNLAQDIWRAMPPDLGKQFDVDTSLVERFNAWREVTLGLTTGTISDEHAAQFTPVSASLTLEAAVDNQMAWITAWRIDRYAGDTLKSARFYKEATDTDAQSAHREESEKKRDAKQEKVEKARKEQLAKQREGKPPQPLPAGIKDFDPDMAQTQLRQAAQEFGEDYRSEWRTLTDWKQTIVEKTLQDTMLLLNSDDERDEFNRMKRQGYPLVKIMFPAQGEASNATQPSGLLRALFDDQVHDSRAWFLHSTFGGREPWGGYFRYRMMYFGDACNKQLSPLAIAGNVVGAATLVGGAIFIFKQKKLTGKLSGLAGTSGAMMMESKVLDMISGEPIPMLPGADKLTAFTQMPGAVISQQKQIMGEMQLEQAKKQVALRWAQAESLING